MKNSLLAQVVYRSIYIGIAIITIMITTNFFVTGSNEPNFTPDIFKYYTNLSNYLCFIVMLPVLIFTVKKIAKGEKYGHNTFLQTFKFYTTVIILVTMIVYAALLGNPLSLGYWTNIGSLLPHFVCPLLFILDWFIFDEHRTVSILDPIKTIIIPLVYVAVILTIGACVKDFAYPYFFLDPVKIGYGNVALWVIILLAAFIALSYILFIYDKLVKIDGKWKLCFKNLGLNKNKPLN